MTISQNLFHIQEKILECEIKYHRTPHSIQLLAVSKSQSVKKIQQAFEAGQKLFGENYLQEALKKIEFFKNEAIEWHYIGAIQSNKTRKIAENFSWVHSVDNKKIAQRLSLQRPKALPCLNICLEVNIDGSPQKKGIKPEELAEIADFCATLPNLKLRGLMAIPELKNNFAEQCNTLQPFLDLFNSFKNRYQWDTLSMGMSNDMEAAIAKGTTLVRIGTGIFGKRPD